MGKKHQGKLTLANRHRIAISLTLQFKRLLQARHIAVSRLGGVLIKGCR